MGNNKSLRVLEYLEIQQQLNSRHHINTRTIQIKRNSTLYRQVLVMGIKTPSTSYSRNSASIIQYSNEMTDKSNLKKIKNYIVSMEQNKLLARGRMGEVRMGISGDNKKLLVFKIVLLPLTKRIKDLVQTQQKLNQECVQVIHPLAFSSTKCYIPYQYLPLTLKKKWDQYKGNIAKISQLCSEMFYCYSYFVGLGLGHGNIKPTNIGFTKEGKLKYTDLIPTSSYDETLKQDMSDFGEMMLELCDFAKPKNDLMETLTQMSQNRISWNEVFNKFGLIARLTKYILEKNQYNVHHRACILLNIAQDLSHNQNQSYLACSIYIYIRSLLKQELRSTKQRSYEKILNQHLSKIQKVVSMIPHRRYFGIVQVLKDRSWFQIDVKVQLQIVMCLLEWVNHQYISEDLTKQASEQQLQIIIKQYSEMVDYSLIFCE